jgi:hypothetical protein
MVPSSCRSLLRDAIWQKVNTRQIFRRHASFMQELQYAAVAASDIEDTALREGPSQPMVKQARHSDIALVQHL